jgi:hypothetical protein
MKEFRREFGTGAIISQPGGLIGPIDQVLLNKGRKELEQNGESGQDDI